MKILRGLSIIALLAFLITAVSCGEDEEPQQTVEDTEDPVVTITAPADGSTISVLDATTSVTITYSVTDDVEIGSVVVNFDGTQLEEVTSFVDFLNYSGQVVKDDVSDGEYTITVIATDLAGNSTTASSTFTKVTANPYTPLANEVFYMSFEGNYTELVTEEDATQEGTPGFAGEGKEGDNAYAGAADSYITFPTTDLQNTEMTASFFMKLDVTADRAGILAMSPEDAENPDAQNVRTSGFRFFREASGDLQIFKLNFGTGDAEVWLDGGDAAKLDPTDDVWHHFAFVIEATMARVYIDGILVAQNEEHIGMDLTGCDLLSIGSGAPRFTGWGHMSDNSYIDELRIFNKALTDAELEAASGVEILGEQEFDPNPQLTPVDGADATELMRMTFDTDFTTSGTVTPTVTTVGSPTVSGAAYVGAADSYITMPATDLMKTNISVSFWVNVNNTPDRAGIIVIGPEDTGNADYPDVQNNRTSGFRFFREAGTRGQRYKLNVGNGTADSWADGGEYAEIPDDVNEMRHIAFTISDTLAQVYMNGILVTQSSIGGLDWTGCDIMSFGSGAPRFTEWGHLADESTFDDLRVYEGVLTSTQVAGLKSDGPQ